MTTFEKEILRHMESGYHCSQIMMKLSLELRGLDEEFTMRALGGLGGGMACARTCGTLTGGVCALSSYVPRPEGEPEPVEYKEMAKTYLEWFEKEHGGIECRDIVEAEREKRLLKCPGVMAKAFDEVCRILGEHGYKPEG